MNYKFDMNKSNNRGRGRPRKNPEKLARWEPPANWVRVVAWVSPEERESLKKMATDTNRTVASLIRSLAKTRFGLDSSLMLTNIGSNIMEKIPTIFERDDEFKVIDKVKHGCEWVFKGEGTATEKLNGTNIRVTIRKGQCVRLEKRRNPTKAQKKLGIIDGWYTEAFENSPEDKWIFEAAKGTDFSQWPEGEHSCEALGPKIQGNTLGLPNHVCVPFNLDIPTFDNIPRAYSKMWNYLENLESKYSPGHLVEGIVFHHPDGRRAKIKRKDFPA